MEVSNLTGNIFPVSYLPCRREKPYSHLKPGQTSLDRDYYAVATHEKPDGKVTLSNYGRFESIYGQDVAKAVKIGDYVVPAKNQNTMSKCLKQC